MQHRSKVIVGVLTVAVAVAGFVVMGTWTIAVARALGVWAYPTFFGFNMMLSGLVLVVILPASGKRRVEWIWLRKKLGILEQKMATKGWSDLMRKGAFTFVFLATVLVSPLAGAVAVRMLGLRGDRAWTFVFLANISSTALWISAYIGLWRAVKSMCASLFAL